MTTSKDHIKWAPSHMYPPFARYLAEPSESNGEAWKSLLREVVAWAAERKLRVTWPIAFEPQPGINIPASFTEVTYELDIASEYPRDPKIAFEREAFEAAFAGRLRCLRVIGEPLLALIHNRFGEPVSFNSLNSPTAQHQADLDLDEYDDAAGGDIDRARSELAQECRDQPLTAQHLQEIRDFLSEALEIEPTDEQIRAVIPAGSETHAVIITYGVDGDTATEDEVADCFCKHLVGKRHPMGIDNLTDRQLAAFAKEIAHAAERAGIRTVGEPRREF